MTEEVQFIVRIHKDEIGCQFVLPQFPELTFLYVSHSNTICPVHYGSTKAKCTADGDVSLTLRINDRHEATLHGSDQGKDHAVMIGEYELRGQGISIKNQ